MGAKHRRQRLVLTYVYDGQGTLDKTGVGLHISPIPPGSGKGPVVRLTSGYRLVVSAGNIQSFTDPSAPRAKALLRSVPQEMDR